MHRLWKFGAFLGIVMLFGSGYALGDRHALQPSNALAADDCQIFSQTGHQVCGAFLQYWTANGGLAQQGYPISDPFMEMSATDGKTYQVQYFERAVFELHPELPSGSNVLLSLLGSEKYKTKYGGKQPGAGATSAPVATMASLATSTSVPSTNRRTGGDLAITLWAVRDNVNSGVFTPNAGNRCFTLDITLENTGSDTISYNALNGLVKAADDRQYDANALCGDAKPRMSYGDLGPGEKIRAWEFFEVPTGAKLVSFVWKGRSGSTITFPL